MPSCLSSAVVPCSFHLYITASSGNRRKCVVPGTCLDYRVIHPTCWKQNSALQYLCHAYWVTYFVVRLKLDISATLRLLVKLQFLMFVNVAQRTEIRSHLLWLERQSRSKPLWAKEFLKSLQFQTVEDLFFPYSYTMLPPDLFLPLSRMQPTANQQSTVDSLYPFRFGMCLLFLGGSWLSVGQRSRSSLI